MQAINWVYQQGFKNDKGERADCEENAISALGKVIYFQSQANTIPPTVITDGFLAKLPLVADSEEAQAVHLLFFNQVLANNPVLEPHVEAVKGAIMRIKETAERKPELELLSDEGKGALE